MLAMRIRLRSFAKLNLGPTLFFLFCLGAHADEQPPEHDEWSGGAESALLMTSGNTRSQTFSFGLDGQYDPRPWTYRAKSQYLSSTDRGSLQAESIAAEARGSRKFTSVFDLFAQGAFLKNRFAGFREQYKGDAGVGYALLDKEVHKLRAELGIGYVVENRTDSTHQDFAAATTGLEYTWKISPTADLSNDFSYILNLESGSDYRLSDTTSLVAQVSQKLSMKLAYKVDYVNLPVTGKKRTDTATSAALVAKF